MFHCEGLAHYLKLKDFINFEIQDIFWTNFEYLQWEKSCSSVSSLLLHNLILLCLSVVFSGINLFSLLLKQPCVFFLMDVHPFILTHLCSKAYSFESVPLQPRLSDYEHSNYGVLLCEGCSQNCSQFKFVVGPWACAIHFIHLIYKGCGKQSDIDKLLVACLQICHCNGDPRASKAHGRLLTYQKFLSLLSTWDWKEVRQVMYHNLAFLL